MRCVTIRRSVLGNKLLIGEKVVSNTHWLVRKDAILNDAAEQFATVEAARLEFQSAAFDAKGNGPIAHGPEKISEFTEEQVEAVVGEIEKRPRVRLENTGLRLRVPSVGDTWTADVYWNVEDEPLFFAFVRSEYANMLDDGEFLYGAKWKKPRTNGTGEVIEAFFDREGADWNWICMAVRASEDEFEKNVLATAKEIRIRQRQRRSRK